ncbi:hypothetical protein Tco_0385967 [Tanacetum coccineum]
MATTNTVHNLALAVHSSSQLKVGGSSSFIRHFSLDDMEEMYSPHFFESFREEQSRSRRRSRRDTSPDSEEESKPNTPTGLGKEDDKPKSYFDSFDIPSDLLSVLMTPLIFTDIPFDLIFAIMILLILGAYGCILGALMDASSSIAFSFPAVGTKREAGI